MGREDSETPQIPPIWNSFIYWDRLHYIAAQRPSISAFLNIDPCLHSHLQLVLAFSVNWLLKASQDISITAESSIGQHYLREYYSRQLVAFGQVWSKFHKYCLGKLEARARPLFNVQLYLSLPKKHLNSLYSKGELIQATLLLISLV